jgi:hypothetical protein
VLAQSCIVLNAGDRRSAAQLYNSFHKTSFDVDPKESNGSDV